MADDFEWEDEEFISGEGGAYSDDEPQEGAYSEAGGYVRGAYPDEGAYAGEDYPDEGVYEPEDYPEEGGYEGEDYPDEGAGDDSAAGRQGAYYGYGAAAQEGARYGREPEAAQGYYDGEYDGAYEGGYEGEYEGDYDGEYDGDYEGEIIYEDPDEFATDYEREKAAPAAVRGSRKKKGSGFSMMDGIIAMTGVAVVFLALIVGLMVMNRNNADRQVSDFVNVGTQLDGIELIGEKGLIAVADAKLAQLAAAEIVEEEENKGKKNSPAMRRTSTTAM